MASFGIIALIVNLAIIGAIAWVIVKIIQAIANRNTKKDGS
jgi:flagellar biogenesis protein FliO